MIVRSVTQREPSRRCATCAKDLPLTSKYFYVRSAPRGEFHYSCRSCTRKRRRERYPAERQERDGVARKGRHCHQCESLPHRRPEDGSVCACGERFEADEPVTLDYVEALPRENRTIIPASGGYE